ncbi:MAG: gspG [Candidatus Paceibacter sp.]|jgi:prepilin-type N-terminal cleavage/methylation domain-containing protein|nr:gspG [Candidatus Paceibacter sp.]
MSYKKGFTLIELLVVIAIISLLSAMVLGTLNTARAKARNAKRMSDLHQITLALNLYYQNNGNYPPEGLCIDSSIGSNSCAFPNPPEADWHASSDLRTLVAAGFLPQLPVDPINDLNYNYYYEPDSTGQGTAPLPLCTVNSCSYVLRARLERTGTVYWYDDSYGRGIR